MDNFADLKTKRAPNYGISPTKRKTLEENKDEYFHADYTKRGHEEEKNDKFH